MLASVIALLSIAAQLSYSQNSSAPNNISICTPGECLQRSSESTIAIGARVTVPGGQAPFQLLPGQYAAESVPQQLRDVLTNPGVSIAPSPGFSGSNALPLNLNLNTGIATYSDAQYSGNASFIAPQGNVSQVLGSGSLAISNNIVATILTSKEPILVWDSISDMGNLPYRFSGSKFELYQLAPTNSDNQCAGPQLDGKCSLTRCAKGQYFNSQSSQCQPCDPTCGTCWNVGGGNCLSCSDPRRILRGGWCNFSNCQNNNTVIEGLGLCLSDLAKVGVNRGPIITPSPNSPNNEGVSKPPFQFKPWHIALMAVGGAILVALLLWFTFKDRTRGRTTSGSIRESTTNLQDAEEGLYPMRTMAENFDDVDSVRDSHLSHEGPVQNFGYDASGPQFTDNVVASPSIYDAQGSSFPLDSPVRAGVPQQPAFETPIERSNSRSGMPHQLDFNTPMDEGSGMPHQQIDPFDDRAGNRSISTPPPVRVPEPKLPLPQDDSFEGPSDYDNGVPSGFPSQYPMGQRQGELPQEDSFDGPSDYENGGPSGFPSPYTIDQRQGDFDDPSGMALTPNLPPVREEVADLSYTDRDSMVNTNDPPEEISRSLQEKPHKKRGIRAMFGRKKKKEQDEEALPEFEGPEPQPDPSISSPKRPTSIMYELLHGNANSPPPDEGHILPNSQRDRDPSAALMTTQDSDTHYNHNASSRSALRRTATRADLDMLEPEVTTNRELPSRRTPSRGGKGAYVNSFYNGQPAKKRVRLDPDLLEWEAQQRRAREERKRRDWEERKKHERARQIQDHLFAIEGLRQEEKIAESQQEIERRGGQAALKRPLSSVTLSTR